MNDGFAVGVSIGRVAGLFVGLLIAVILTIRYIHSHKKSKVSKEVR